MDHNKIHLTVELDLDVETVQKNNVTLEKVLDWFRIRNDCVVNGFAVSVDAPSACAFDERLHLPGGFYALKRVTTGHGDSAITDQVRETVEIVQQGNPFAYVKGDEDVIRLVNSLVQHTEQKSTVLTAEPFGEETLTETENVLLQACCLFLWYECPEDDHNLCSVMKLLQSGCDTGEDYTCTPLSTHCVMNYLFEDVAEREPDHCAVSAFAAAKTNAGPKFAQEALLSCIHRMETMTLSELHLILTDMKAA